MAASYFVIKEGIRISQLNSFFKMPCSSTYEFLGETHNFWEALYVLRGTLCVTADDRVYHLSAGQIIFHQPLELHKFHITDKNGAEIMVISYDAEGSLNDFFREKVFSLNKEQKKLIDSLLSYADSHAEETDNIYIRYHTALQTVPFFSQRISLLIQLLMLSLAENNSITPLSQIEDSGPYTLAVRYMTDRISENLTVEEIAAAVHLSVSALKRIFKKYAGMGVHKYFLKLKLKTAIELLENGDSVTEIAKKLNFSSQAYFTNVFKRETGESPSLYRNKMTK
ncbi:MAG: helix-turn-helix transcriptional regulator [Clostridia bacterium]|nr:helix-turn-helix transcriptional regulator [Clostridia bacterium]